MSYCNNQTDIAQAATSRKRQTRSPGFWLFLAGGSVLLHLILIGLVEGLSYRPPLQGAAETVLPVDWVELPDSVLSSSAAVTSSAITPGSTAVITPTADLAQFTEAGSEAALNNSAAIPSLPSQEGESTRANAEFVAPVAVSAPASVVPPNFAAIEEVEPETLAAPTEKEVDQTPLPSPAPTNSPQAEQTSRQLQATQPPDNPSQPFEIEERPIPLPQPSPLIATQPIDVPVPDVMETLPPEAEKDMGTVTEQIAVPSELTASLTTALPEASDPPLDEAAYPKQEVQTFAANSTSSPCMMSPEAVPFLGKTVAMQVMTDESGQVVDTVTQESSQSTAYDELATCLVKNWDFEPAIAQGQPVATDGLVVRITIEADS